MQSISESLSAAVRAAIVLTPGERVAFVGQHLRAQHAGLPLPQPSAISRRATQAVEAAKASPQAQPRALARCKSSVAEKQIVWDAADERRQSLSHPGRSSSWKEDHLDA